MQRFSFRTPQAHGLTIHTMNAHLHPIIAGAINPFAMLSAESGEHRLATVTHDELAHDMRPVCSILPDDITYREDDRNVRVWDVWDGQTIASHGHSTYQAAAERANEMGYRIEALPMPM
jgi:hypothetical protein